MKTVEVLKECFVASKIENLKNANEPKVHLSFPQENPIDVGSLGV